MCRRFQLLYRIEEATAQEIIQYLRRLWRVYIILLILTIIGTAFDGQTNLAWNIATIVLYTINIGGLYLLYKTPCIAYTYLPMISSFLLACLDSIQMVYILVEDGEYLVLLRLISITIQLTTIYIAFKLREKMNSQPDIEEGAGGGGGVVAIANPVYGASGRA